MKTIQADNLSILMQGMLNCKGPVGVKIARNYRMINDELIDYRNARLDLFRKYGEQVGDQLKVDKGSENYPLFLKEMTALDDMKIEFSFRKITEEELNDSGLTSQQMLILMDNDMVEEKDNDHSELQN